MERPDKDFDSDSWSRFVRACRRTPLFLGKLRIRRSNDSIRVTLGTAPLRGGIILMAFGLALIAVPLLVTPPELQIPVSVIACCIVGALVTLLGIYVILRWPKMWWVSGEPDLFFRFPVFPWMYVASTPRSELYVSVDLSSDPNTPGPKIEGQAEVQLMPSGRNSNRIILARGPYGQLAPLLQALRDIAGSERFEDLTLTDVSQADENLKISRAPLVESSANFENMRLVRKSEHVLVLRPTAGTLVALSAFSLAGILTLVWGRPDLQKAIQGTIVMTIVGIAFTLAGLWSLKWSLADKRVRIDRNAKRIVIGLRSKQAGTSFDDVAGVQICSYQKRGDADYLVYELNLVFARPDVSRLNLLSHSNVAMIYFQARMLAEFLGDKPLWDHAAKL